MRLMCVFSDCSEMKRKTLQTISHSLFTQCDKHLKVYLHSPNTKVDYFLWAVTLSRTTLQRLNWNFMNQSGSDVAFAFIFCVNTNEPFFADDGMVTVSSFLDISALNASQLQDGVSITSVLRMFKSTAHRYQVSIVLRFQLIFLVLSCTVSHLHAPWLHTKLDLCNVFSIRILKIMLFSKWQKYPQCSLVWCQCTTIVTPLTLCFGFYRPEVFWLHLWCYTD